MKIQKQVELLRLLNKSKYRVNAEEGTVESYRKAAGVWKRKIPVKLPNGYRQIFFTDPALPGGTLSVGEHIAVWIAVNGMYKEGLEIDHLDRDPTNNRIDNLRLVTNKENKANSNAGKRLPGARIRRHLSLQDRLRIWEYYDAGVPKAQIAKHLRIDRGTVLYQLNTTARHTANDKPLTAAAQTPTKKTTPSESPQPAVPQLTITWWNEPLKQAA